MTARRRVLDAHGDAWQVEGRARLPVGGGAAEIRGARLMASGIPAAKWNNADITEVDVDLAALEHWYDHRTVPWGVRVPLGIALEIGTPLFVKRCLYVQPETLRRPPADEPLRFRKAGAGELGVFAQAEVAAFGDDLALTRRWLEPVFGTTGFEHWLATRDDEVVAIASAVRSDERAGPAIMLTGVAPLPEARNAATHCALVAHVLECAFAEGIELGHIHPFGDVEDCYRLGFIEVPGFQIRVVKP